MISTTYDEQICSWIREHKEEILSNHMALCRIPSVQASPEQNAPFGKECARALESAAALFENSGFDVRIEKDRGYALASFGEGEKTIGVYGHSDVVPAGDGWIKTSPFEPRVIDGVLFGRGVGDNKAGVTASLYALRMIKELSLPIRNRIQVFIGSNEESGMADITSFVKNEKMPELNLVPDSRFPCSVGEKGILRLWVKGGEKFSEVLDFTGGNASNIVLDEVKVILGKKSGLKEEILSLIGENKAFELEEKEETFVLFAHGASKHAGAPENSVNAAYLAAELLSRVSNLCKEDRAVFGKIASALSSYYGEGLEIYHEDADFGNLTAVCGMVRVEDGYPMVNMDIRYGTSFAPAELEKRLSHTWGQKGFAITSLNNRPGFMLDKENPIPAILQKAYQELSGMDKKPLLLSGGTYSRYLKNSFTVGFRGIDPDSTVSLPEMPAGHGGAHQRDEAIILDQFYQAIRILTHYLLICDEEISK